MGIERYIIPFIVVILLRIKPIGTWLATINTFFHEGFHALTALLLGNKVKEIEFDQKLGGSCSSLSTGKFKTFLTALSGYTGCNLMSLILIYAINNSRIEITFLLLAIFSLLIIVLYMRKTYALVWTLAFAATNLICYMIPFSLRIKACILYTYIIAILFENTIACFEILKLSFTNSKQSGDCSVLHKVSHIPPFLWAIIFNAINALTIYKIALMIL